MKYSSSGSNDNVNDKLKSNFNFIDTVIISILLNYYYTTLNTNLTTKIQSLLLT